MPLAIQKTKLSNVIILTPKVFKDNRGYFTETFRADELAKVGFKKEFIQDNQSFSSTPNTLRGFHFQTPPYSQDKLVRVNQGSILDIVVDIRTGSPTYGQHLSVELSSENFKQLLIPSGFAHAFLTLEADTIVSYKVTNPYAPECDSGIIWNDSDLEIEWPNSEMPILSKKDTKLSFLKDLPNNLFPYEDFSF